MNPQLTPTQAALCAELDAYCRAQGLPFDSADELVFNVDLTAAQRAWLHDYCNRWDRATGSTP